MTTSEFPEMLIPETILERVGAGIMFASVTCMHLLGYTLTEWKEIVAIVVSIVGLIAGLTIQLFASRSAKAHRKEVEAHNAEMARIERYRAGIEDQ